VAAISLGRGADPELVVRQDHLLGSLGYKLHHQFDDGVVRSAMQRDKKRHKGRQRWILPMEIGRVIEADDVSEAELSKALEAIRA
jgi:3-dehydroquinate synthetase